MYQRIEEGRQKSIVTRPGVGNIGKAKRVCGIISESWEGGKIYFRREEGREYGFWISFSVFQTLRNN